MKYGLLARVSGEEQVEGYSLDAQVRAFNTLVEAREGSVYHQWIEEGVSARTDDISKRPLFRKAIDEALAGRYDVLVVHKLDRFSRNVRITLEYLEKLEKAGVGFVSITEQMDFSTPRGRVILANLAAFGQYYSDNLSAEVSKGLKERAAQGLWVGPVPFGYIKGDDGSLEVVPGEAEAVHEVFSMYASGNKTYREIATWLNQSVHETRSRRRDGDQRRYLWTRYSVSGILTNPFYLGNVRYKGQPLPGNHPPLVSQELFDAVQEVRKEHRTTPSTFARRYRTYLLKGLVRCVSCGGKVWAQHVKGQDYYREENTSRGLDCPNGRAYQRAGVLDEQVCAIIGDLKLPNSWRELVSGYLASGEERKKESNERHRLEEKLRRIRVQYREGDIDRREYQQESALTKAALDATRVSVDDEVVRYGDHIEGLVEAWGAATLEERHQLLTMMLDAVYVDMAQGLVLGVKPKPEFLPLFKLGEPVTTGDAELVTGGMEQSRTTPRTQPGCVAGGLVSQG